MADRYTYLPSIGLFLVLIWGACEIITRLPNCNRVLFGLGLVLLGLCTAATWQTTRCWRNSETLLRHSLASNPNNFAIQALLGNVLWQKGETEEARMHFREALRFKPSFVRVYAVGKGGTWAVPTQAPPAQAPESDLADAAASQSVRAQLDQLQAKLAVQPQNYSLQNALGGLLLKAGDIDGAIKAFERAVELKPEYAQAHNNLGILRSRQGMTNEALQCFQKATELDTNYCEAHFNLGIAYLQRNEKEKAIQELRESLRINPDLAVAQRALQRASGQSPPVRQ